MKKKLKRDADRKVRVATKSARADWPGPAMNAVFDLLNEHAATEDAFLAAVQSGDKAGMATAMSRKVALNGSGVAAVRTMLRENPGLRPGGYDPDEDDSTGRTAKVLVEKIPMAGQPKVKRRRV